MIRQLRLRDVGPARDLKFDFGSRLNVLTGDNGLGKTFVLDVLWWVLTNTWAGEKAFPWRPVGGTRQTSERAGAAESPSIEALSPSIEAETRTDRGAGPEVEASFVNVLAVYRFDSTSQRWVFAPTEDQVRLASRISPFPLRGEAERVSQSLVVYARVDGRFAVWDGYAALSDQAGAESASLVLTDDEVWNGKTVADATVSSGTRTAIAGLISDWVRWQERAASKEYDLLTNVLRVLSPPDEPLRPGRPTRVHVHDRRDIPTLDMPYGEVPATLASAGFKRTLSLAYLLVWAWTEHLKTAAQMGRPPVDDIVLLVDEPELHLHPSWQRAIVPAVMRAVAHVAPHAKVQVITATHSPLVLASLESVFEDRRDELFVLERSGEVVRASEVAFGKEGDVSNWLASAAFGGVGGRSREAELAIGAAMDFMAQRKTAAKGKLEQLRMLLAELPDADIAAPGIGATPSLDGGRSLVKRVHAALMLTVPGHDEFWAQWNLVHRAGRGPGRSGNATR